MARPCTYDRQEVLDKATELFWRKGYEATTLDDILKATGFNRHSLYSVFGSKDGLYLEALKNYRRQSDERLGPAACETGLAAIGAMFKVRMPFDSSGKGCLFTNTINEKSAVPPEAFEVARQSFGEVEDLVYEAVRSAQADGDIPESKDPKALATYVVLVLQGLGTMSKAGLTVREAKKVAEQTMRFLTS